MSFTHKDFMQHVQIKIIAIFSYSYLFWNKCDTMCLINYFPGVQDDGSPAASTRRKRHSPTKSDGSSTSLKLKIKVEKQSRVSCKICQSCIMPDCGKCSHCADMVSISSSVLSIVNKLRDKNKSRKVRVRKS